MVTTKKTVGKWWGELGVTMGPVTVGVSSIVTG